MVFYWTPCWSGTPWALDFSSPPTPGRCGSKNSGLLGPVTDLRREPASLGFVFPSVLSLSSSYSLVCFFIYVIGFKTFYLVSLVVFNFQLDPGTYTVLPELATKTIEAVVCWRAGLLKNIMTLLILTI